MVGTKTVSSTTTVLVKDIRDLFVFVVSGFGEGKGIAGTVVDNGVENSATGLRANEGIGSWIGNDDGPRGKMDTTVLSVSSPVFPAAAAARIAPTARRSTIGSKRARGNINVDLHSGRGYIVMSTETSAVANTLIQEWPEV